MSVHPGRPREIFVAAVKLPAAERDAYLAQACGGDGELLQRVRDLLEAHRGAGSFLDHPAGDLAASVVEPSIAEGPGAVIGPYRLLSQIGEGGMGLVFAAEQEHPVRRKVALKVIKPGLDTRQVIAGEDAPADGRERLAFADLGYRTRRFELAARFFDEALAAEPALAEDAAGGHRYNAACAAALAGAGVASRRPRGAGLSPREGRRGPRGQSGSGATRSVRGSSSRATASTWRPAICASST